jgi:hypothetical protein
LDMVKLFPVNKKTIQSLKCFGGIMVICVLAAGCTPVGLAGTSTLTSVSETATLSPTKTELPTATLAVPTATATLLPQPTPIVIAQPTTEIPTEIAESLLDQKYPTAQLIILNPGPGSRITSPLNITAFTLPGYQGKVTLQLWGEDARLMGEQLVRLGTESKWITFASKIPFEITSAGESAVLTLTTYDSNDRRVAVNSVPLLLLQIGDSVIESNSFTKQPFRITTPKTDSNVSGGTLHIEGLAHPYSSAPLIIELIKTNGAIVASKQVALKPLSGDELYTPFSIDIPFKVSESTPVRLTLVQGNDQAPRVDLALCSQLITLKP